MEDFGTFFYKRKTTESWERLLVSVPVVHYAVVAQFIETLGNISRNLRPPRCENAIKADSEGRVVISFFSQWSADRID